MEISLTHYGRSRNNPSTSIELTVKSGGNCIIEDITNLKSHVDASLIQDLRDIADELEEQNRLITNKALENGLFKL